MSDSSVAVDFDSLTIDLIPAETLVRRRRTPRPRSKTQSMARLSQRDRALLREEFPEAEHVHNTRPRTRGECDEKTYRAEDGRRICPWVSCRHHLAYDMNPETGSIKENFPGMEIDELPQTCSLDVSEQDGLTLEEVAAHMNLTRERVRQLETRALAKIKAVESLSSLSDYVL